MNESALVHVPILPLMTAPRERCELSDEALCGMAVELLEERPGGWFKVRTPYRYEGYAHRGGLTLDRAQLDKWGSLPKQIIWKAQADVLNEPNVQGWQVTSLTRGAQVAPLEPANEGGWVKVALCDGREGYTKAGFLREPPEDWHGVEEAKLRQRLIDTAKLYLGVQYRWGGKTPQGIDCSGLCSMAYLLNGITIWRDADVKEGFEMRKITLEEAGPGDLIFMKGHVVMHLGGGDILHATAHNGSDGVVYNSLNPAHAGYREDLTKIVKYAGTIF